MLNTLMLYCERRDIARWLIFAVAAWLVLLVLLAGLALVAVALDPALAQEVVATAAQAVDSDVVAEDSWLHGFWEFVQPIAASAMVILGPAILGGVLALIYKGLQAIGINVSEQDRKRFHDAAFNAVMAYLAKRSGALPDLSTTPVPPDVISGALEILKRTNPEGVSARSAAVVEEIVTGKVPAVAATLATAAAAPAAMAAAAATPAAVAPSIDDIRRAVEDALKISGR